MLFCLFLFILYRNNYFIKKLPLNPFLNLGDNVSEGFLCFKVECYISSAGTFSPLITISKELSLWRRRVYTFVQNIILCDSWRNLERNSCGFKKINFCIMDRINLKPTKRAWLNELKNSVTSLWSRKFYTKIWPWLVTSDRYWNTKHRVARSRFS